MKEENKKKKKKEKKQKIVTDLEKWVGDVKVKKMTELGERKLAYTIAGSKSADYVLFELEGERIAPDASKRIEMSDDILRHLMIRTN